MKNKIIALFGEAQRGELSKPLCIKNLNELLEQFGNPPDESLGLYWAIQALSYQKLVLFARVKEEGFSRSDYFLGFKALEKLYHLEKKLTTLFLPGVGDAEILNAAQTLCSILVTSERDLYDYLSSVKTA